MEFRVSYIVVRETQFFVYLHYGRVIFAKNPVNTAYPLLTLASKHALKRFDSTINQIET